MPGQQVDRIALGGLDHGRRLAKRDGHRLLDDDVLSVVGREDRVLRMESVRARNPDRIDVGVFHQPFGGIRRFGRADNAP